jgi:hypothetical protein
MKHHTGPHANIGNRPEESHRRPSADFVARFKEQHFSAPDSHGNLKDESDDLDYIGRVTHSVYDLDPTPKAGSAFRLTPSLLDPSSSAFAAVANQPPNYTPTPSATAYDFGPYEMGGQSETYHTPDSITHPNTQATTLFQTHLHPLDPQNYVYFRPHSYGQDSYHGLSIPGSSVCCAVSESSPSNYSPENGSGPETTDPELYLARDVHRKYMAPEVARNSEIYGQYTLCI